MNIIVCSSRGKSLLSLNKRKDTEVTVVSGGRIKNLTNIAIEKLKEEKGTEGNKFVYVIAGLPDTTRKLERNYWMNSSWRRYEEVSFLESVEENSERVIRIIKKSAEDIIKEDGIPICSTIVPQNLTKWNHVRLRQHKTSHLIHFHHYDRMQENLLESIKIINSFILHFNSVNQVATPKITLPVFYKRRSTWRFRYGKLPDGVHASQNLAKIWVTIVRKVLDKNLARHSTTAAVPSPVNRERLTDSESSSRESESDCEDVPSESSSSESECEDILREASESEEVDSDASTRRSWLY